MPATRVMEVPESAGNRREMRSRWRGSLLLSFFLLLVSSSLGNASTSGQAKSHERKGGLLRKPLTPGLPAHIKEMQPGLRLYRAILKQHRIKLPVHLRKLGDDYVREEFKRHKDAKMEFLQGFFTEWGKYLTMLRNQQGQYGAYLSEAEVKSLNQEQLDQLQKLRQEAEKAFRHDEAGGFDNKLG